MLMKSERKHALLMQKQLKWRTSLTVMKWSICAMTNWLLLERTTLRYTEHHLWNVYCYFRAQMMHIKWEIGTEYMKQQTPNFRCFSLVLGNTTSISYGCLGIWPTSNASYHQKWLTSTCGTAVQIWKVVWEKYSKWQFARDYDTNCEEKKILPRSQCNLTSVQRAALTTQILEEIKQNLYV